MFFMATAINAQVDRTQRPEAGPAPKIQIGQFESFTLENGLKVFVIENHKLPRVSFSLTADIDNMLEGDKVGLSSMAGDLMSAGTESKTKEEIDESIDFMGANLTTYSSGFFASSLTKHMNSLLDITTDILYNPSFPEEELAKMKKRTISGLKASKTNPDAISANIKSVINYGSNHPSGEIQTIEHVENITIEDCKNYFNTYFRPNVSYLVIVGDITIADAKPLVEKYFASWEKADVPGHEYSTPQKPSQTEVHFVNKPGSVQSIVTVTNPINLKLGDEDEIAAKVMNSILGGGVFSGRLMQNLREDKAYTYGARSSLSAGKNFGTFSAGASVRNIVTDSSVTEFMYELRRLVTEKVTEDELSLIKNSMNGSFARSLERPQTIARFALNIEKYNLPKDYYDTYLERLSAVTIDDIYRVAQKYITPENTNIIVVGNKAEVAEKLARFSGSGKVNFYDFKGNALEEENKKELPEGLTAQSVIDNYIYKISNTSNAKQLKKKLKKTKSFTMKMKGEIQGFALEMTQVKTGDKSSTVMTAMGQTMQQSVFDGKSGYSSNMQTGKKDMEADEIEDAKMEAKLISEMHYEEYGFQIKLIGIETHNGNDVYVVEEISPEGRKTTTYYNAENKLKVYSSSVRKSEQGEFTIESEFNDYKEVDGFWFPHTIAQSFGPQAIEFEVTSIKVNGDVDADLFK